MSEMGLKQQQQQQKYVATHSPYLVKFTNPLHIKENENMLRSYFGCCKSRLTVIAHWAKALEYSNCISAER